MAKKMLIDASHREELRMAIIDGNRLQGFETESLSKKQLKSNIYLAKVIRIEPSLQACFVEFGGNRQGFLPFGEIHPDYYQIPVGDRIEDAIIQTEVEPQETSQENVDEIDVEASEVEDHLGEDDGPRKHKMRYRYKIQEVIKRKQIMLIQVVREERGNKGAALTTYLTLPGRYCVLMPNSGGRSGGISRKISDLKDRKRLREVLDSLDIPEGVSLIIRTAGSGRTKLELKRDFEYLLRLWSDIRDKTMTSIAPALIYEEGDLIKRALRDTYDKDIDEVFVDGEDAYKDARALMRTMLPSHAKKVLHFKDKAMSLFQKFGIEDQIDQMFQPSVPLPAGGSIVIAQTEALVAVDVNSGKSTRERHIDDTAVKTNLEAAKEIARQIRLRDLGGLIVIDFIDMNDKGHIANVERTLREAIQMDRARIQLGKISQFGLLELSRQRLRPSIQETHTRPCDACHGTGLVRSIESMALFVLRQIEAACVKGKVSELIVSAPTDVDLYLLNQKRAELVNLENLYGARIFVKRDPKLINAECHIETVKSLKDVTKADEMAEEPEVIVVEGSKPQRTQERRHERARKPVVAEAEENSEIKEETSEPKHSRSRNRFNKNKRPISAMEEAVIAEIEGTVSETAASSEEKSPEHTDGENSERKSGRRRRFRDRRRRRGPREGQEGAEGRISQTPANHNTQPQGVHVVASETVMESSKEEKAAPRRNNRSAKKETSDATPKSPTKEDDQPKEPKKTKGWWKRLIES